MKLSRETSRNRFLKLPTVKFIVSGRPYTSESRKLERFETDHPQSLNPQISKQQNNSGTYFIFYFIFLRRKTLSASLFVVLRSFPFFYIYIGHLSWRRRTCSVLTMRLDSDSRT